MVVHLLAVLPKPSFWDVSVWLDKGVGVCVHEVYAQSDGSLHVLALWLIDVRLSYRFRYRVLVIFESVVRQATGHRCHLKIRKSGHCQQRCTPRYKLRTTLP